MHIFVVGSERRNRVHNPRSRSSKVVDFGTNRKGECNFFILLVINSNRGPRYGDLLTERTPMSLPHSHLTPSLGLKSFEYLDELFITKFRILGLSVGEYFAIVAMPECDVRTDGLADDGTRLRLVKIANCTRCKAANSAGLNSRLNLSRTRPTPRLDQQCKLNQ